MSGSNRAALIVCVLSSAAAHCVPTASAQTVSVSPPSPVAYQPVVIDLDTGFVLDELSASPNPFLDYRLQVEVTSPSGEPYIVPGYFDGDGNGTGVGGVFRVKFSPTEAGTWSYAVRFRAGPEIAIELDTGVGVPAIGDGLAGAFEVAPPDASAPGFLAKGRLDYDDGFYLRFADGSFYIKGGVDSPENWLGYVGFDNTFDGGKGPNTQSGLHEFPTHAADWNPGDPDWDSPDTPTPNDGRAIIGALNYLASTGVNSIYFLPMNIGGDGKDSWPFADPAIDPDGSPGNNNLNYDVSKLAQWAQFFDHAQAKGLMLHFVLNEAEAPNKRELDGYGSSGDPIAPALGVERKLFYREMVARFGYLNAKQWNLSEEYNLNLNVGSQSVLEWADYIAQIDPWGTPTTVHNAGNPNNPTAGPWAPFVGQPDIDLTSLQNAGKVDGWSDVVEAYRDTTQIVGRPLPVMVDEPGSPTRDITSPGDLDEFRKRLVWEITMSGGGAEWFIHNRDQSLEDFREFDQLWRDTGAMVRFFEDNLPYWDMTPDDGRVTGETDGGFGGADALVRTGDGADAVLAVYYPNATSTGTVDLNGLSGDIRVRWFNPRTYSFEGAGAVLTGDQVVAVPAPPSDPAEDWVALFEGLGTSDCNGNGIPDADEIAQGLADDCDNNGVPDDCQTDCDANGVADACQTDSDGDGVIDPCDLDCNNNFITDSDELAAPGGLAANYFPSLDFTGSPLARIDPVIDFDFGASGPGAGISGLMFSSRWTGFVRSSVAGVYSFFPTVNDGVRLWVDSQLIVDEFQQQTATEFQGDIALPADTWVPIAMEHFQNGGTAVAELRWTPPGGPKAIVPEGSLAPALDADMNGVPDACDPECPTDGNNDGVTDLADLLVVLANFGQAGSMSDGDTNNDGVTDLADLLAVLAEFGNACP